MCVCVIYEERDKEEGGERETGLGGLLFASPGQQPCGLTTPATHVHRSVIMCVVCICPVIREVPISVIV